jgi:integrase
MRNGACVIRREGKRGVVWLIKFRDADGRQKKERLGPESDGWTKPKAKAELEARLTDVRREGLRTPLSVTFASFADEWLATYPDAKGLKRSTRGSYKTLIERHLKPELGHLRLEQVDVGRVDRYLAAKRREGLQPRTLNRQLNLLNLVMAAAVRRQLVRVNPVTGIDRPREPRRHWTILSPLEVGRVERAFAELSSVTGVTASDRAWLEQARVIFLTVISAGLRRGEILGLRWKDVDLADPAGAVLRVRETFVRGAEDTPKSEAGARTIALGPKLSEELWQHRRRTAFAGDEERVFGHPEKGSPLDPNTYAVTLNAALERAGVERKMRPFHDGRHTSITNSAAAGLSPAALMSRAGHSNFKTTQGYIDLAGETFRAEAGLLEQRLFGADGYQNGVPIPVSGDEVEKEEARETL